MRVDEINSDFADGLKFSGSSANVNCALRTLRRMLHKAEEWKLISRAPKINLMKEHGRSLRLDDDAERENCLPRLPFANSESERAISEPLLSYGRWVCLFTSTLL